MKDSTKEIQSAGLLALVKARSSVRSFKPDKVERAKLEYILEVARLAPSAVNFQPWCFVVVREPERLKALYDEWQELLTKNFLDEKVTAIEERVLNFGKEKEAAEPAPIQTAEPAEPTQAPAEEPLPEVGNKADDTAAPAEATEDALDDENKDGDNDDEEKAEDEDNDSDEENEKDNEEEQNED